MGKGGKWARTSSRDLVGSLGWSSEGAEGLVSIEEIRTSEICEVSKLGSSLKLLFHTQECREERRDEVVSACCLLAV